MEKIHSEIERIGSIIPRVYDDRFGSDEEQDPRVRFGLILRNVSNVFSDYHLQTYFWDFDEVRKDMKACFGCGGNECLASLGRKASKGEDGKDIPAYRAFFALCIQSSIERKQPRFRVYKCTDPAQRKTQISELLKLYKTGRP